MKPAIAEPAASSVVRFGTFVFDPASGELTRQGRRIALQDQPARVLSLLVKRPGHLVTREEMRVALWPDDTFVEFEAAIAVAINKIRRALGDSAANPRFVETIPKHGYRFLADVHLLSAALDENVQAELLRSSRFRSSSLWIAGAGALIIVAVVAGAMGPSQSAAPTAANPVSLTVMPFRVGEAGLRANAGVEVADAVVRRIAPLGGIRLTPWLHGSTHAGPAAPQLGRELGADAVLDGTLDVSGDRVDVSIALLRTRDGSMWWRERFEVARTEIASIENRVAEHLANYLQLPLTDGQRARLTRRSTASIDAYRWFLEGRWFLERRNEQDLRTAVAAFRRAIEADPAYALAYAWLANAYGMQAFFGSVPPWEGGSYLLAAADRALQLDDSLAEAHLASAGAVAFVKWRWADADAMFRKALELNPGYAEGRHWYAVYLELVGRMDEAWAQRRRASELDPKSLLLALATGDYFLYARQPERAVEEAEKLLRRNPSFLGARALRGRAYDQAGRFDPAIADLAAAHLAFPENVFHSRSLVSALAGAKREREARFETDAVVKRARQQYVSPYEIGLMYAALDERDTAFHWFEKACDIKDPRLGMIRATPRVDRLRQDPRFQALLVCVGLS